MKPRPLRVAASRDLGPQFADNRHRMVGQDGAFSIALDGRETLWFFGDTLIGTRKPGESIWYIDGKPVGPRDMSGRGTFERMINNTGLLLRDRTGRDGLTDFEYITDSKGGLKTLIPLEGNEHPDRDRMWCQHGCAVGDEVFLSFIKVKMLDAPGPFPVNFEIVGSGLSVGRRGVWDFKRLTRDGDSILWRADEPHFATAFLPAGDVVYLYGTVKRGDAQQAYLARTHHDGIGHVDRYEYFSGDDRWSAKVADAVPLFGGMPSELSVSYNAHLGAYLAVHSLDLSGQIVGRTAPQPWGPWGAPVVLWTADVPPRDKPLPYPTLIYAGKEHPTLAADGGKTIYLTYIEFEDYFPHLVEVTLQ